VTNEITNPFGVSVQQMKLNNSNYSMKLKFHSSIEHQLLEIQQFQSKVTFKGRSKTSNGTSVVRQGDVLDSLTGRQMAQDDQSPSSVFGNVGFLGLSLSVSNPLPGSCLS
jgi:hypothetical protein